MHTPLLKWLDPYQILSGWHNLAFQMNLKSDQHILMRRQHDNSLNILLKIYVRALVMVWQRQCSLLSAVTVPQTQLLWNSKVCLRYCIDGQIFTKYVGMEAPIVANAIGIHECINTALKNVNITQTTLEKKLVAVGCDRASVIHDGCKEWGSPSIQECSAITDRNTLHGPSH